MKKYKIDQLVSDTKFSINGQEYVLTNNVWNTSAPGFKIDSHIGNGVSQKIHSCNPVLGGMQQKKIEFWISVDSEVTVK